MGLGDDTTTLCLVRHGETAWNAERRLQGHLDIPLNETGRRQAVATATVLAGHRFAAIYTSDLGRAHQTAAPTGRHLGIQPAHEPALRERHYGAFQGLTYEEVQARFPGDYQRFINRDPSFAFPKGGESLGQFSARISAVLHRIARDHAGAQVLIVTHGGVLDAIHRIATGTPLEAPRDFAIPNAALNWISFSQGRWRILAWAEQHHLTHTRDELPAA